MRARLIVVLNADQAAGSRLDTQLLERVSREILRSQPFLFIARVGEDRRPDHLRAHRKERDMLPRRVTDADKQRIVEGIGFRSLRVVGWKREVDEPFRLTDRQRPEDQRVDERERRDAGAERQRQRQHGGAGHRPVFSERPDALANIANHRIEPREQLDVSALLAEEEGIAKPARHRARRGLARLPAGHQLADALVTVELELLVELALETSRREYVRQSGPPRHCLHLPPSRGRESARATARLRYACFRILPTAAVIAFQRTSSDSSCRRPATVIS